MRESAEHLRPYHAEEPQALVRDLGERSVEDVCQRRHAETGDDGLTSPIEAVRDDAERERDRDLEEETDGCHRVRCECAEAHLANQRGGVRVEATLGTVLRRLSVIIERYTFADILTLQSVMKK